MPNPLPARRGARPPNWTLFLFLGLMVLLAALALIWQPWARVAVPSQKERSKPLISTLASTGAPPRLVVTNEISLLDPGTVATNGSKRDRAVVGMNQQANQLMLKSDFQGAVRLYEKALTLSPDDEDLHYNLGIAYAKAGELAQAEEQYRAALRLLPDYAEVHNNLGNLLLRTGRLEEAAEHLNEAIHLQAEYPAAYNNLGIVREKQKRLAEAAACFEKAVQFDTNYLEAHFNLGSASLIAGNHDKAISEFREVLRIDPAFEPAQRGLAKAMQQ